MNVVIGVDPHKASHTAVAIDEAEDEVSSVKVRATRRQVEQLVRWAEPFEKRRWARRDGLPVGPRARGAGRRSA
jgi:transposase